MSFKKRHKEIGEFSPGRLGLSLKIWRFMGSFCLKYKTIELKNYKPLKNCNEVKHNMVMIVAGGRGHYKKVGRDAKKLMKPWFSVIPTL